MRNEPPDGPTGIEDRIRSLDAELLPPPDAENPENGEGENGDDTERPRPATLYSGGTEPPILSPQNPPRPTPRPTQRPSP
ncbi:hypothetical protein [Streptomyces sp. enrichment culture]|uniref:hypothetical protein n=1 Tax=Streptomyces sp. enrichment culture TaxID=1795815 RepID=UPI003F5733B3